jgi:hypothetical protein
VAEVVLQSAASSTPLWDDIATVVNDCIRTAVILIAGAVGYMRFVRGRVLHSNLAPSISSEIVRIGNSRAMKVTVTIENSGSYRMTFPLTCSQMVRLECVDSAMWKHAAASDEVGWSKAAVREINLLRVEDASIASGEFVTVADEELEPGEQYTRCRLILIPPGNWAAYRITLEVSSCSRMIWRTRAPEVWKTDMIMLDHL